ncbi:hypothetical protein EI94DRAFT_1657560 [Lactarius quietus]|nr:hypothetical protein EI94DRAFT_1657560 [Lactarius quietus]
MKGSRRRIFYGPVLRFLDHTNLVVTVLTALAVLYTRSVGVVYFSAGALACMVSVKILKLVLQQSRPVQTTRYKQKQSYGMPSTHSATIIFYGTYVIMACATLPLHQSLPESSLFRPLTTLVAIPWAFVVPGSRVWLGHHTIAQVVVGCAYGFIFACIWFSLWTHGLNALGEIVENHVRAYIGAYI